MKIISISGLDGSGKTTQVKKVIEYLESTGKRVYTFHAIEFSLANQIISKTKSSEKSSSGKTKASWLGILLRKLVLPIDLCRFNHLRKKLDSSYDYLVTDRYFYDSVINIFYLGKSTRPLCLEKNIPRPDVAVYLTITPEAIMQRERIPEQGLEYLQEKKKLFDQKSTDWKLATISGTGSPQEIFEKIKALIG